MIIAGTGHRLKKLGFSDNVFNNLVDLVTNTLKTQNPDKVISGMALGFDQALAVASLNLNIPFISALPFIGQKDVWPNHAQNFYENLLKKADEIVVVSEGGFASWKMQTRNIWMVDNCDLVLALWDGSSGGTKNCLDYVKKCKKPYMNLWQEWENLWN